MTRPRTAKPRAAPDGLVCLGVVTGAHGVRGEVRVKPFTAEPRAVASYGPLTDEEGGRVVHLTVLREAKGGVIARIDGVDDRDQAAALKGLRLYVARASLPKPEADEYYHADLIGLDAVRGDGTALGTVRSVDNFGAGDVLEVALAAGGTAWIPFTKAVVPEVDREAGRITVEPPPGLLEDDV